MFTGFHDQNQQAIQLGDRACVRHYWSHGHDAIEKVKQDAHGMVYVHVDLDLVNHTFGLLQRIRRQ